MSGRIHLLHKSFKESINSHVNHIKQYNKLLKISVYQTSLLEKSMAKYTAFFASFYQIPF